MRSKHSNSLKELLQAEWQSLHECFYFLYDQRDDIAKRELKEFFSFVVAKSRNENFNKYAEIWLYRLFTTFVTARFSKVQRQFEIEEFESAFCRLAFDQQLTLLMRDRKQFSNQDAAAILQVTPWAVEQRLFHAREDFAEIQNLWQGKHPFLSNKTLNSLHVRIVLNKHINLDLPEHLQNFEPAQRYQSGLRELRKQIEELPKPTEVVALPEIEIKKASKFQGQKVRGVSWSTLPWHFKLLLEGFGFALAGAFAVVVLPVAANYYQQGGSTPVVKIEKNQNRQQASITSGKKLSLADVLVPDQFSEVEFPSGHDSPRGAAPLAPSRRKGNIYRLIVQSANPKDLIPRVEQLLTVAKVDENIDSGKVMPGGIYFDGITTESQFDSLETAIRTMGKTKTYANRPRTARRKNSNAQARVIIWIQQI